MGRPLKVPKLDFVGSLGAPYSSRELHLQELVGLMPVHLGVEWRVGTRKGHLGLFTRPIWEEGHYPAPSTSVWKRT